MTKCWIGQNIHSCSERCSIWIHLNRKSISYASNGFMHVNFFMIIESDINMIGNNENRKLKTTWVTSGIKPFNQTVNSYGMTFHRSAFDWWKWKLKFGPFFVTTYHRHSFLTQVFLSREVFVGSHNYARRLFECGILEIDTFHMQMNWRFSAICLGFYFQILNDVQPNLRLTDSKVGNFKSNPFDCFRRQSKYHRSNDVLSASNTVKIFTFSVKSQISKKQLLDYECVLESRVKLRSKPIYEQKLGKD